MTRPRGPAPPYTSLLSSGGKASAAEAPSGATSEVKLLWAAHGHPNIVGLVGIVGGGVVVEHLILELCAISLSERSLARQTPELRRLITIDTQLQYHLSMGLLNGLAHLHSLRICHRDVKPSNTMIFVRCASVTTFLFCFRYGTTALTGLFSSQQHNAIVYPSPHIALTHRTPMLPDFGGLLCVCIARHPPTRSVPSCPSSCPPPVPPPVCATGR